jgi:hypothetical protein
MNLVLIWRKLVHMEGKAVSKVLRQKLLVPLSFSSGLLPEVEGAVRS